MHPRALGIAELDDRALVASIHDDHDRAPAEAELCARYRRRVYLYGLKHLRNAAAADDLVQDVFTTVLQRVRAGAVDDPSKLGAFVLGTCKMIATSGRRTAARRSAILAMHVDTRAATDATQDGAHHLDLGRVHECLQQLAERDRTVLLLSFYAELDAGALGREIGVDAGHVRVLRHRAMGRLQLCVNGKREAQT